MFPFHFPLLSSSSSYDRVSLRSSSSFFRAHLLIETRQGNYFTLSYSLTQTFKKKTKWENLRRLLVCCVHTFDGYLVEVLL